MDSGSITFIFFGLAVALMSNFSRSPLWRSSILALATVIMLAILAGSVMALLPLFAFVLAGYIGFRLLQAGWITRKAPIVIVTLVIYAWLKKYTVLPGSSFLSLPYMTLGLSYILFRALHVIIDAQVNGRQIGPFRYFLYTLNFTTFVSGPIQRYDDFAKDKFAREPVSLSYSDVGSQLYRIAVGFFKVAVLALALSSIQKDALAELAEPLPILLKLRAATILAIVYPFFLYANFSGYIDIVIALARLMRLRLPENFDRPFSSTSFIEFWTRWHITLSNWLKTYVYNPLLIAMMRRSDSVRLEPFFGVACFFVTFFLVGIWHGRTSEFVVFGILQGGGVAINKLWQVELVRRMGRKPYKKLADNPAYRFFGRGLTFCWFAFTLFWFWGDWRQIGSAFSALSGIEWVTVWLFIWVVMSIMLEVWNRVHQALISVELGGGKLLMNRYAFTIYAAGLVLGGLFVSVLLNLPAPDIVYKAF